MATTRKEAATIAVGLALLVTYVTTGWDIPAAPWAAGHQVTEQEQRDDQALRWSQDFDDRMAEQAYSDAMDEAHEWEANR